MKAYLVVYGYSDGYSDDYEFDSVFLNKEEAEAYVEENNRIPYDEQDELHDVYTVQQGKLNLKLSKKIIQELTTEFVRKGSPLLDQSSLRRPKRLKGRAPVKTFYNIEVFGPNGKIPDGALYAN